MRNFKYLYEFLSTNYNLPKIQFIKITEHIAPKYNKNLVKLNEFAQNTLYDIIIMDDNPDYTEHRLDPNRPILYYGGQNSDAIKIFKNKYNKDNNNSKIYNFNTNDLIKCASKVKFHKILNKFDFIPKTVFLIEDTKKLKFPIIAKPENRMSGLGIEVFKSYDELKQSKSKFDLYSECVDFVREYRSLFLKDKLFTINERIPIESDNKTIFTKDPDEKVKFVYIEQDLNNLKFINDLIRIHKEIYELINIDFHSLDFFVDKNNKIWIIEMNSGSGLGANNLVKTYESIYSDFYRKNPPKEFYDLSKSIIKKFSDIQKKEYKEEYKKSLNPAYD